MPQKPPTNHYARRAGRPPLLLPTCPHARANKPVTHHSRAPTSHPRAQGGRRAAQACGGRGARVAWLPLHGCCSPPPAPQGLPAMGAALAPIPAPGRAAAICWPGAPISVDLVPANVPGLAVHSFPGALGPPWTVPCVILSIPQGAHACVLSRAHTHETHARAPLTPMAPQTIQYHPCGAYAPHAPLFDPRPFARFSNVWPAPCTIRPV